MVIIFDVDGTLIGGEEQDWPSFSRALETMLGFHPDREFWESLEEVTGRAILRAAARRCGISIDESRVRSFIDLYLDNLRKAHELAPGGFPAKPGASEILDFLRANPLFSGAIATGDFRETIQFKLDAAGLDVSGIPLCSASDHEARRDIIALAADRAGYPVHDAVYVGDGWWDLRACEQLDIPFLGTGSNTERLKANGATLIIDDLSPASVLPVLNQLLGAS